MFVQGCESSDSVRTPTGNIQLSFQRLLFPELPTFQISFHIMTSIRLPCMITVLFLVLLCGEQAQAQSGGCWCGWFVSKMWAPLSNLEPLDYLPSTTVSNLCGLAECQRHCANQGNIIKGVDLNENVGGKSRGQKYCEQIYALIPEDVDHENLFVLSRVPDCENFFVWGSSQVYTSSVQLCCMWGNYVAC